MRFLLNYVLPALHLEDGTALGKQLEALDAACTAEAVERLHLSENTVQCLAEISKTLRRDANNMLTCKDRCEGGVAAARLEASRRTRSGANQQGDGKKPTLNQCGLDQPSTPYIPQSWTITSSEREACEAIVDCITKLRGLCAALADLRVLVGLRDGPVVAVAPRF